MNALVLMRFAIACCTPGEAVVSRMAVTINTDRKCIVDFPENVRSANENVAGQVKGPLDHSGGPRLFQECPDMLAVSVRPIFFSKGRKCRRRGQYSSCY